MIENVMHHIGGVGTFGIISICLFFAFFSALLLWAALLKKPYLNTMGGLPLEQVAPDGSPHSLQSRETSKRNGPRAVLGSQRPPTRTGIRINSAPLLPSNTLRAEDGSRSGGAAETSQEPALQKSP